MGVGSSLPAHSGGEETKNPREASSRLWTLGTLSDIFPLQLAEVQDDLNQGQGWASTGTGLLDLHFDPVGIFEEV